MHQVSPVALADIEGAARRIAGTARRTPLLELAEGLYAKAENLQLTGSFKLRGATNFLAQLPPAVRARGVVAHSSGNHAQGVACAAKRFGVPATIVIPDNAPAVKVARTLAWGATVVRCENSSTARERAAGALVESHGYTLVPPFDHPWIVAGQGTAGLEIAQELPGVANVLVCVGGGGLLAGVTTAVRALLPEAQVIGVEPELAADAQASLRAGRVERWEAALTARTVADGVRTQNLGAVPFALIRERVAGIVTVSEAEIVRATRWYLDEAKLVVEPTGALTLAAYWRLQRGALPGGRAEPVALRPGPTALLISGGNAQPSWLAEVLGDPPRA
jgi:threo-3-hydroxy-L-aspartate ammonia-lyase